MRIPRLTVAALMVLACTACAIREAGPPTPLARAGVAAQAAVRGGQFAARACSGCHAVNGVGVSPMAEAPPFREIVQRRRLDELEGAFAEGLVTSHPAMPDHVFRASDIDDLIAYLEALAAGDQAFEAPAV